MKGSSSDSKQNHLIGETSPYLLQHAHNPVDWYPWGEEAIERSRQENRLILLSIGYAACHWCHVMERESFENEAIAALMNDSFVNVKVDREERPDLDEIYMAATVTMNQGQGGWPMTVFLTPDLEPVFAGTYFPPTDGYGRPGFPSVLKAIAAAWRDDRDNLRQHAARVAEHLRQQQSANGIPMSVGVEELERAVGQFWNSFDRVHGGFGAAPKFPHAPDISFLLRMYERTGDERTLEMVTKTLDAMASGGIYDHIGGGFARYSTDREWLVPHFEKMLYDNALLAAVYLEGYQVTGADRYRTVASETLSYVAREMTAEEGGFYSSTDADSEGEEGKFFVWTSAEVDRELGTDEARVFNAFYDVTDRGNWEGRNILNTPQRLEQVAQRLAMPPEDVNEVLMMARQKMRDARSRRIPPATDDKILAAWNGLMIGAFAAGYRVLGDEGYLANAVNAADFVLDRLIVEGGTLLRTYREGRAHLNGCLEDYGYVAEGLVDLHEVTGSWVYLQAAERLVRRVARDFTDTETGAFFSTGSDHEELLLRHKTGADGGTPAPNAAVASAMARLSYHLDDPDLRERAMRSIEAYGEAITRFPRGFAKSLLVADFLQDRPVELALVGNRGSEDLKRLCQEVARRYLPRRVEVRHDPTDSEAPTPLAAGKTAIGGHATLYLCRDYTCAAPITDPSEVVGALDEYCGIEGRA